MKDRINELYKNAVEAITSVKDGKSLDEVKVKFLGKSGKVTELLKGMRDVPAEERPTVGQLVNELRTKIEKMIGDKENERKKIEREQLGRAHV